VLAILRVTVVVATFLAITTIEVGAATMLAVTDVARAYGFICATESTQAAVELARPGLSLVVRAGDPRYQVNDDVRYLTRTPVFKNNEIYVDVAFERVLADLAAAHPWPVSAPTAASQNLAATTPVLTIAAKYVEGAEAIHVSGTGPPGFLVSVVLKAIMSRDVPIVVIGRAFVQVDADGKFGATIPAGSIGLANTSFIASASGRGIEPVTAEVPIQKPNPNLHSPNDGLPKG
jgi:hypothetical protein